MKISRSGIFALIVILYFTISPCNTYSQFGGFLKKGKEAIEGAENKGCDALKNLEKRMESLRENSKDLARNGDLIPSSIDMARSAVKTVNNKCKHIQTDEYEKEIDEIAGKYKAFLADKNAMNKDAEFMDDAYDRFTDFKGYFTSYKGMFLVLKFAQEFYDNSQKLDYLNTMEKIKDFAAKYPDVKTPASRFNFKYKFIADEFPKLYEDGIENYFIPEVNNAIEASYATKAQGKSKMGAARDQAKCAVLVSEGVLLAFPDNTKMKELHKVAKDGYDKIEAEFGAAIYTSDFHKDNVGNLVFASKKLMPKKESSADVKDNFTGGENIYAMIYMDGSIREKTGTSGNINVEMYVDDNKKGEYIIKVDEDKSQNTCFLLEIAPDAKSSETNDGIFFTKTLAGLSPRKHTVKLVSFSNYKDNPLGEGEFTVDLSSGQEKYSQKLTELEAMALDRVRMPKALMKNKSIENKLKGAIKRAKWKEKTLRIVIMSSDWKYEKNSLGIVLNRFVRAAVAVKNLDGTCSSWQFYFYEPKVGSKWGQMKIETIDETPIGCKNVNK